MAIQILKILLYISSFCVIMFDKFVKRKEVFFMKKQILSITLAAALAVSCTGIAMAEDKTPTVFVNQGQIFFDDQAPVILGEGTTLVPARGVFEAMGAKVEWKEDTRTVDVTSSDNKTLIRLTIDDSTMKVFVRKWCFRSSYVRTRLRCS